MVHLAPADRKVEVLGPEPRPPVRGQGVQSDVAADEPRGELRGGVRVDDDAVRADTGRVAVDAFGRTRSDPAVAASPR